MVSGSYPEEEEVESRQLNLSSGHLHHLTDLKLVVVSLEGSPVPRVPLDGLRDCRSTDISRASGPLWRGTLSKELDAF